MCKKNFKTSVAETQLATISGYQTLSPILIQSVSDCLYVCLFGEVR